MNSKNTLLELRHVSKAFPASGKGQARDAAGKSGIVILDNITLSLRAGEIVAVLGRSGCGKSTLLRIIAGLVKPSQGSLLYRNKPVAGPVPGISMVFQNFALFPWLDVLDNVRIGLESQGIPMAEQQHRALEAIDMIGLDGFESAYPKELSGGMRQRVGFARALVVQPDVLLMDEAFSALDVPTAETLRDDLLDLWLQRKIPTQAILMVSHNIEESLLLADRLLILDTNPGRVKTELPIRLPHPRDRNSEAFRALTERVYETMTRPAATTVTVSTAQLTIGHRLPGANIQQMLGVLDQVDETSLSGTADLADLADELEMEVDELFPLVEALELLGFARAASGELALSDEGWEFLEGDIQQRKMIFRQQLLQNVPLAEYIVGIIHEQASERVSETVFLLELNNYLTENESERVLEVMVAWGRYAELFAYDYDTGEFSLENPETELTESVG